MSSGTVSAIPVNSETVNRKLGRCSGELDFSAVIAGDQNLEAIFGFICWPKERDLPTVAEWDPFNPADIPGNPAYQGGVSAPFGIRRFAFGLPANATKATLGDPRRYITKGNRLYKPGFELRWFVYVRSNTSSITWNLTLQAGQRIYN